MALRPGGWAWVGLATGVIATDAVLIASKNATMSEVFGDTLKHPIKKWPVLAAWLILTLHLFGNLMPKPLEAIKRYDPIRFVAHLLTPRK